MDENPPNCGYPHGDCVLSAYIDDLTTQLAQAAPVLAALATWYDSAPVDGREAEDVLIAAYGAWRAAREG